MIDRTATELLAALHKGDITSEALTGQFLKAIRVHDTKVKAFLHVDEARAEDGRVLHRFWCDAGNINSGHCTVGARHGGDLLRAHDQARAARTP